MSFGRAFNSPCANPCMIWNAASRILSILSRSTSAMRIMASTTAGISSGSASPIPDASVAIICTAASSKAGRLSIMPCTSAMTSCKAPSVICGSASINACNRVMTIWTAASIMTGRLSTIAPPMDVTISKPTWMRLGRFSISIFTRLPTVLPMTSLIFVQSPPASDNPRVNSPRSVTLSSANIWRWGSSTVPSMFLAAALPALSRWMLSSNLPRAFSESSLITAPIRFASSVSSAIPAEPCAIKGFSSWADFPKICMASTSRSVSFDTLPSASMVSQYTVSLSRRLPLASVTEIPSCR